MTFRDEQTALRARLQAAQTELARVEHEQRTDRSVREELNAMLDVLAEAEEENESERQELATLRERLASLEAQIGLKPPAAGTSRKTLPAVLAIVGAATIAVVLMFLAEGRASNKVPESTAPMPPQPALRHANTPSRHSEFDILLPEASHTLAPEAPALIQQTIRAHRREVRDCYETAVASDSPFQGTITLYLTISTNGRVDGAASTSASKVPILGRCLEIAAADWSFPPHAGPDPMKLAIPLIFAGSQAND